MAPRNSRASDFARIQLELPQARTAMRYHPDTRHRSYERIEGQAPHDIKAERARRGAKINTILLWERTMHWPLEGASA